MGKTIQKKSESGMQKAQYTIPKELHKRFKRVVLEYETTMSLIVVDLIRDYVEKAEEDLKIK